MAKRRARSQSINLISNHSKSGIALNYMCASGMPHIVGNILMRLQLCFKPCLNRKSTQELMGLQRGESLNFGNFKIPNLGVPR
jgi:hypothetical protein